MEYQRYQLRDIGDIVSGATPKTTVAENFGGAIPWLTPADLSGYTQKYISRGKRNLTQLGYDSCSTQIMPSGTVLFSSRAPIGYTAIAKNPICTNQGFKSIVPKPFVNSEFLYYQLIYLRKTIQDMGSGTTFKEISAKKFGAVQVTIPPLVEQEHIISRIEELFSQLDVSVNELKTAKERLKVYRQAVLKEAFDSVQDTCEVTTIQSVCEDIKVGIVIKPTQYYVESGGIYAFRNANVRRGFIEDSDWAIISKEGHEKNKRSEVHTGDVLIARSGVNLGMASAVSEKFNGYNAIDVVIAVPKHERVLSQYLAYYTNSPYGMNSVKSNQRGVAQGHLNVTVYGKLPVMLPPLGIQKQVVSKIEEQLSICDEIEKTVDTALQQAEALRQSILKKAFEGGL